MIYKYSVEDARREVKELLEEGYGFGYIRIFLHDLARSRDISWEDCTAIQGELITGKFGNIECSFSC